MAKLQISPEFVGGQVSFVGLPYFYHVVCLIVIDHDVVGVEDHDDLFGCWRMMSSIIQGGKAEPKNFYQSVTGIKGIGVSWWSLFLQERIPPFEGVG